MHDSPKGKSSKSFVIRMHKSHCKPKSLEVHVHVGGTFKIHQCKQEENKSISDCNIWPPTVILVHSPKDPYEINLRALVEFIIQVASE